MTVAWEGRFLVEKDGCLNALRFITKNVLSIMESQGATIDWLNHYMMLPLARPLDVRAGDVVQVSFAYRCGGSIPSLEASIRTELVARFEEEGVREQVGAAVYA
jgi:protein arginine N-methyltransferase 1